MRFTISSLASLIVPLVNLIIYRRSHIRSADIRPSRADMGGGLARVRGGCGMGAGGCGRIHPVLIPNFATHRYLHRLDNL
ncbi:hypothetical protein BOTBODRAFT_336208 [Botryobasidium botryosum FD-172 SS1]|uniref:Uncharacterized protein n=1 Tax=Botryobasidium botryosum (strain FD-172 SS1) TaxID=930990 RepID=A0A067MFP7_BOTB1|nr:hypothetical protein BOTBODRAFT_336208 [Botryobasidium botryosum FD-172 SS1]